jgi:hypothetical protein
MNSRVMKGTDAPKFPVEYPLHQALSIYAKRIGVFLGVALLNFIGLGLFKLAADNLPRIVSSFPASSEFFGPLGLLLSDETLFLASFLIPLMCLAVVLVLLSSPERR